MTSPLAPTATLHVLAFDRLSPFDFERLCLALVQGEGYERVEHPGAAGGEQGRDLTARRGATRIVFQCKRVQRFGPADARAEVVKLLALPPDERPHEVVFLVSCQVSEAARSAARKAAGGDFTCEFWAVTELDTRLQRHPEIIRKFFRPVAADAPPSPAEVLEMALTASATHLDTALRKVGRKYRPELYIERSIDPAIRVFLTSRKQGTSAAKVLIATAGTGKTNLACHMARLLRELRIPCVLLLGSDPLRDRRSLLEDVYQALGIAPGADWRQALRALSSQDAPVAILLDGINEARDVKLMQHALRELLAEIAPYPARVLVTCRDIYWTFLQGDWTEAIPTEILRPDLYHYEEEAWPVARAKYFSAYRIRGTLLGEADRRCRHPLLFRFFCEAYEDEDVSTVEQIRLPPLFEKYLERKVAQIARERISQLRAEERVTTILHAIAAEMLDTRAKSVPEARIPSLTQDRDHLDRGALYVRLLDEDIMIEEIPDERLSTLRRRVRFVYEAFFEFMLARVLAGRWDTLSNPEIVADLVERLEPNAGLPNVLGSLQFLGDFFHRRGLNVWKVFLGKGAAWQSLVVQSLGEMRPDEINGVAREAFRELATSAPPNLRVSALDLLRKPDLRAAYDPSFDLLTLAVRSDRRAEVRAAAQAVLLDNWHDLQDEEQMAHLARTLFDRAQGIRHQARRTWLNLDRADDRLAVHMASEIRQAFTSPTPRVRSAVAEAIDPGRDLRERPFLLQGLRDENSWVRSACLRSLADAPEPTGEESAAVAESLNDPKRRVRIAASRVCRVWQTAELTSPLLRRIAQEEDPGVLASLLATAGKVGGAEAVPVLREHLGHPHPWVFRRAGWGLWRILGVSALDELVNSLRRRSEVECWPLHRLLEDLAHDLDGSRSLHQRLFSGFNSPHITPVTGAFLLGSYARDLVAHENIVPNEEFLRAVDFVTAKDVPDDEFLQSIHDLVTDQEAPNKEQLLRAIHDLVARDADPVSDAFLEGFCLAGGGADLVAKAELAVALLRRAGHPDPWTATPAVHLLVASETPVPDDILENLLKTNPAVSAWLVDWPRQRKRRSSLASNDKRRARLRQLLADSTWSNRSVDERARILAEALADPSTVVVKEALKLLIELGAETIRANLPAILSQLGSRNRAVRVEVSRALAQLGREEAEAPLLKFLADPERTVRRQAVELITRLLGKDAIPHLLLALLDPAPLVRIEACLQLAHTPAPEVFEALLSRLQDSHPRVQQQALNSLATLEPSLALRHAALVAGSDESPEALIAGLRAEEDDDIPF